MIKYFIFVETNNNKSKQQTMKTKTETPTIGTTEFFEYLSHLGLFWVTLTEEDDTFIAILTKSMKPDVDNFTIVTTDDDGFPKVYLAKDDLFNEKVTNGFFEKWKTYTFWFNNKLDGEFEMSVENMKTNYLRYLKDQDVDWVKHYDEQTVTSFIGDKKGLSSTCNFDDIGHIQNDLRNTRDEYLKNL